METEVSADRCGRCASFEKSKPTETPMELPISSENLRFAGIVVERMHRNAPFCTTFANRLNYDTVVETRATAADAKPRLQKRSRLFAPKPRRRQKMFSSVQWCSRMFRNV